MYLRHKHDFSEVFEFEDKILQEAKSMPKIKTLDGSRPSGVHVKGTALFIRILRNFGEQTIIDMLKSFIALKEKTTHTFLNVINPDVREFIKANIY